MLTPEMVNAADRVRTFPPDKLPELREAFAEIAASDLAPDAWRVAARLVCEAIDETSAGGDPVVPFLRADALINGRN